MRFLEHDHSAVPGGGHTDGPRRSQSIRRVIHAVGALVLSILVGASLTGPAQAGDAPDRRIHGERVPGVGIVLSFGTQTCVVNRRGACRAWLRTIVGQLDRSQIRATFTGDFRRAKLSGLRLVDVDFSGAQLIRADFRGADVRGVDFTGTDLRRARFGPLPKQAASTPRTSKCQTVGDVDIYCDQAKLTGAKFIEADIRGVDFSHAAMSQVTMSKTQAQGANFTLVDLQRSDLDRTNFDGAIFNTTLLRSAVLTDSSFLRANMFSALFYGTLVADNDFTGADVTKASFKGSLLQGNDFTGVTWGNNTCPDYSKSSTGCPQES